MKNNKSKAKIKKQKKQLSPETKYNLKVGFGSLFSNNAVIEAGKHVPFWIAIIVGLVAAFLPLIPIMRGILMTNGDAPLNNYYTYSFDKELSLLSYELTKDKVALTVNEEKTLVYSKDGVVKSAPTVQNDYVIKRLKNEAGTGYTLEAYYLFDGEYFSKNRDGWYNYFNDIQYKLDDKGNPTLEPKTASDKDGTKYYIPTRLYFYNNGMNLTVYKYASTDQGTKFVGELVKVTPQNIIASLIEGTKIAELVSTGKTLADLTPQELNDTYAKVYNNLRPILIESYASIKERSLTLTLSIYGSIYVGLILLLGLLMFILTRSKKNFNNYLRWHQCLRMSAWASFTPGVLAMILSFILPNYAVMFFILLFGVRIMWMTMKQLSPSYVAK